MSSINRVALGAAIGLSAVALYDAAHVGLTGRTSGFSDELGLTPMMLIGGLIHGITYAVLVAVLVTAGPQIDAGSRARRWFRRMLIVDFGLLAAAFLIVTPFTPALQRTGWDAVMSGVAGFTFLLMFVLAVALGVASVRRPEGRVAGLVLIATVPLMGLAVGLGALGSEFAHPAYPEATVYVGIALLAYQVARRSGQGRADLAAV